MSVAEPGYCRLTDQDRFYLKTRLALDESIRSIARELGRATSTLSREMRRNATGGGHCDVEAGRLAHSRRLAQAPRPAMNHAMRLVVHALLAFRQWSPEQIVESLRVWGVAGVPCVATLYKHIHQDKADGGHLYKHLRHGGRKRRGAQDAYPGIIFGRVGIEQRPTVVDARARIGDFEADLIVGAKHKGFLLVLLERRTGKLFATPLRSKKAPVVAKAIIRLLRPHKALVQTITFDNGREFSLHQRVARALDCRCYFADPYASCQKGAVENGNGLLRQYFPKRMRLDGVTAAEVDAVVQELNQRPRKRLGWDTPELAWQRETSGPMQGELWYKPSVRRVLH